MALEMDSLLLLRNVNGSVMVGVSGIIPTAGTGKSTEST